MSTPASEPANNKEKPQKYDARESEARWVSGWEQSHTYRWDPSDPRPLFRVDTPPPTVSGSLHMGHIFSYTQTDICVRYQRMSGRNVFYPMGWDDNGLPTERRVQNKLNIRCNPELPYDPEWLPKEHEGKPREVSRRNFIEACDVVTKEDEQVFERLWRRLGLSVDWTQTYATIDAHCRRISQYSFLDLVQKGFVYNGESPTMWDVDFRSAVAQADLEDRERPGAFHDIEFGIENGGRFTIATTRPELLASCIAVVAHPTDARYQPLFGKHAITPLFGARIPIMPSDHADPEKGTGILMVCTFGDAADVTWWKQSGLLLKASVGVDGRMRELDFHGAPFTSTNPTRAAEFWSELVGLRVEDARKKIAEILAREGTGPDGTGAALLGTPKPTLHPVKFYEKGDRPIEFITTRQWFVRLIQHKEAFLKQGAQIAWFPAHMKSRFDGWVDGLAHDWCISRQRYFGVPFPVWYQIDAPGTVNYSQPIFAEAERLPVDPMSDVPEGFTETQRNQPGGFIGDPDVMDTWATSSITPHLNSHWGQDNARHSQLFPMDIRPQAHDIIRTWAFYTIAKAWMHSGEIPWKNIVVSGWILDPDRKKMSKSKGNVVTPEKFLDDYSADAVRYWAGKARLGVDTALDMNAFTIGTRLSTKLFNACRFVLTQVESSHGSLSTEAITHPLDRALADYLCEVIKSATDAFEHFDYAQALQVTEGAFWFFCDNYLELVKGRSYASADSVGTQSAHATLAWAMKTFLRLFAPTLPFITEELWSRHFAATTGEPSIHHTSWPSVDEVRDVRGNAEHLRVTAEALAEVHALKTREKRSLGTPLSSLRLSSSETKIEILRETLGDLGAAARVPLTSFELAIADVAGEKAFVAEGVLETPSPQPAST